MVSIRSLFTECFHALQLIELDKFLFLVAKKCIFWELPEVLPHFIPESTQTWPLMALRVGWTTGLSFTGAGGSVGHLSLACSLPRSLEEGPSDNSLTVRVVNIYYISKYSKEQSMLQYGLSMELGIVV